MNRCKDCKWWEDGTGVFRDCKCPHIATVGAHEGIGASTLAVIWNWDGECGIFKASPDFGCILFEAKEESDVENQSK